METISWIFLHWQDIVQIYLCLVGAASVIIKLTPTQKDDNVLKKIVDFVDKFIALNKKQ